MQLFVQAGDGAMASIDAVRALMAVSHRRDKAAIISDAFLSGNREFFIAARLAYDKLVRFGVSRVVQIAFDDLNPDDPGTFSFADFIHLSERLRRRDLSGSSASTAIAAAASACHGPTWNLLYRPVLLKDLKPVCDDRIINAVLARLAKSLPEAQRWLIPEFGCQMATDTPTAPVTGRQLLDVKLAGVRVLAALDKSYDQVTLFRPTGQTIETFAEVRACLRQVLAALPGSVMLDGVVVSPLGTPHLTGLLRNPDRDSSATKLAVFDIVPLADFRAGLCPQPQWLRHQNLSLLETSGLLRAAGGAVSVVAKQEVDLSTEEGAASFAAFAGEAMAAGRDRIVVKDPEAPYQNKKSTAWLTIIPDVASG